jgi:hypothetical protein
MFQRNISPPSSGSKGKRSKKASVHLATCFYWALSKLHDVTTQKTAVFIAIAMRASDQTFQILAYQRNQLQELVQKNILLFCIHKTSKEMSTGRVIILVFTPS